MKKLYITLVLAVALAMTMTMAISVAAAPAPAAGGAVGKAMINPFTATDYIPPQLQNVVWSW